MQFSEIDQSLPLSYFISDGRAVKIGKSTGTRGVLERLKGLQTGNPFDLFVVAVTHKSEGWLHDKFDKQRIRGEWFCFEVELVDFINSHETFSIMEVTLSENSVAFNQVQNPSILQENRISTGSIANYPNFRKQKTVAKVKFKKKPIPVSQKLQSVAISSKCENKFERSGNTKTDFLSWIDHPNGFQYESKNAMFSDSTFERPSLKIRRKWLG